jgi:hypothetical protein
MLLLSSGFVGLASTLLVYLIKRYKSVSTSCIRIYLFIFFLIIATHYNNFYGTNENVLITTLFSSSTLFFLLGPILFFYIRNLLYEKKIVIKKDWVHFIPFLLSLICILPWLFSSFSDKEIFAKELMNNRLLLMVNPNNILLVEPQILMILIPIHVLTYLVVCLYQIIKDDSLNPGIIHTNATLNTLTYLFLLFQCYVAIMYSIGSLSIFYQNNLSDTLVTNFPPESFNGTEHGIAALMILVIITTILVLVTSSKKKDRDTLSNHSALR